MDIDAFWNLIEECRRQGRGRDERAQWLLEVLSCQPQAEIVQFQTRLDEVTHQAFTWELWAAADRIFGGWCSDDGFCYFGLWMVGLGRRALARAVVDPDSLADAPEIQRLAGRPRRLWNDDWPEWEELDYIALEAHGLQAGTAGDCGEAFHAAVDKEQGARRHGVDPAGERWDVRCEDESARGLPHLSSMFPLLT
ncbi:DUF4240 domain-containing protein [Streptomyces longispororuber]|uniref:DUF4240 domain-containing protein n=1 Tax=Streptomyces longispororuber TaxID=68230 RepID=UPI00210EDA04|nr:DUF4240 domain-containing protein [Streptomyces longispororuber]MCQ4210419.1 DUF4240 domain-containing protein [Streptomyces longispororuber]